MMKVSGKVKRGQSEKKWREKESKGDMILNWIFPGGGGRVCVCQCCPQPPFPNHSSSPCLIDNDCVSNWQEWMRKNQASSMGQTEEEKRGARKGGLDI